MLRNDREGVSLSTYQFRKMLNQSTGRTASRTESQYSILLKKWSFPIDFPSVGQFLLSIGNRTAARRIVHWKRKESGVRSQYVILPKNRVIQSLRYH